MGPVPRHSHLRQYLSQSRRRRTICPGPKPSSPASPTEICRPLNRGILPAADRPVASAAAGVPASTATWKSVGEGCSLADQFYPGRGTPQGRFAPFPSLRSVREPPYRGAEVPQVTDAQEGRD